MYKKKPGKTRLLLLYQLLNIIQQLTKNEFSLINESFDYLLKLPIYTLSQEEIDKLTKEKDELTEEYNDLQTMTINDIWLEELKLFEKMHKKFLKQFS